MDAIRVFIAAYSTQIFAAIAGIGAILSSAISAYLSVRMKNLATHADADRIRAALELNTHAVKTIESNILREDFLMKAELAYRERQLSMLYGPVYAYLKGQQKTYDLWMSKKLEDRNFTVKKLFKDQNEKVRSTLVANMHLLDDAEMKGYVSDYFTSTLIFDWYAADSPDSKVPDHLAEHPNVRYPREFNDHIFSTTERLKARIQALNARFAIPLDEELPQKAGSAPSESV
ncbi:hypothetical protein [Methylobacterium mesophilicum]|uniref:hypothetical protein n=1 Tax=Methylobacterium mesophilicum TaxID=39956 RepID=UPI002F34FCC7